MSLPTPKLDDIGFDDLRKGALNKIHNLCPTWTDFNPSDPGITLIELMAWMTEVMIYRLNRVPEKNYINFLELMGVKLSPPRPARCWVVFELAKAAKEDALPAIDAGARVLTKPNGGEAVVFETTERLNLTSARIKALCSRAGDRITDHTQAIQEGKLQEIFGGQTRVSHGLYLGSARLANLPARSKIVVTSTVVEQMAGNAVNIEWEAWDGVTWAPVRALERLSSAVWTEEISFEPGFAIERRAVVGEDSAWLRARLVSATENQFPFVSKVQVALSLPEKNAKLPETVFLRKISEQGIAVYQPVDLAAEFVPFGHQPAADNALLILSNLFGRHGAQCHVRFVHSEQQLSHKRNAHEKVRVSWEYWSTEEGWQPLGADHGLRDGTEALTREGVVEFVVPNDLARPPFLQGRSGYAIRVHPALDASDVPETNWARFRAIRISFTEPAEDFEFCFSENYGAFRRIAPDSRFQPFIALPNEGPTFCLGLDSRPANQAQRLYFQLDEQPDDLTPLVVWEYWTAGKWHRLRVLNDTTRGLSTTGALDFIAPADWLPGSPELDVEGYWTRARREICELSKPSLLRGVHLNATDVVQAKATRGRVLGSSTGEPFQTFLLDTGDAPLLPDLSLLVRELENPQADDIQHMKLTLGAEVFEELNADGNATAIISRWQEVENFFHSGPEDCHYVLDLRKRTILFGDGKNGRIPPKGRRNVVAESYFEGGGKRGNVGKNTITVLEVARKFVKSVRNVEAAQGGTDAETIDAAKLRGPWALRHRYRAVTVEDYEHLAREASTEVALAKCFAPTKTRPPGDEILVVIVPRVEKTGGKLRPSSRLIETVRGYLDERRLLTTKLIVTGPDYDDLDIGMDVALAAQHEGRFEQIKNEIQTKLAELFHPYWGGPKGLGWPMGQTVHLFQLYPLLVEQVEGRGRVEKLRMRKWDAEEVEWTESIEIGPRAFPYCRQMVVRRI